MNHLNQKEKFLLALALKLVFKVLVFGVAFVSVRFLLHHISVNTLVSVWLAVVIALGSKLNVEGL